MDQSSSQEPLKLGRIGYLNVLPIYYPLESGVIHHSFSIVSGPPSYLNQLMARGELDVSVVSSIEYARHPENYFILPDFSISCCGAVKSVLLLSQVPIHELENQSVLVSTQSHTSVALLKILFSFHFGLHADFITGNCSDSITEGVYPAAFLAIGDEALKLKNHHTYRFCLDLGEAWFKFTRLPFVFALWVVQRKSIERWNGRLEGALDVLSACKRWGQTNMDIVCAEALKSGLLDLAETHSYYSCLGYDLGDTERKGLELFYRYLLHTNEIQDIPHLEVYSPLACVA